ncbi:MAG: maleylacetoacetate isomerase [Oligoflexales bacterium]
MKHHITKEDIKLFQYWRSSCSWRVRWALRLKEIPHEINSVNLKNGEQEQKKWLEKHPGGLLPQLHYKDKILSQSLSILEWLEETHPTPSLLPRDSLEKQKVRELCHIIACDTQPLQNLRVLKKSHDQKKHAYTWIHKGLTVFEYSRDKKDYFCYGNQITMADLCFVPQWYNALRFDIKKEDFPLLHDIYIRCLKTEPCFLSSPQEQPDAMSS